MTTSFFSLRFATLACALMVSACASDKPIGQMEDKTGLFSSDLGRAVLSGSGLIDDEKEKIDYRPRSPLVVPPRYELKPPQEGGAAQAAANWPKDKDAEDLARRRMLSARSPAEEAALRRQLTGRMSPDELSRVTGPGSRDWAPPVDQNRPISPDALKHGQMAHSDVKLKQPGQRTTLNEPPSSLRQPVPGADGTVPLSVEESDKPWWKRMMNF